jgi:hypothetical protein
MGLTLSRFGRSQALALGLVCLVVFVVNYFFIVSHFLAQGGYLLDSGWFASLVYHNPLLTQPDCLGGGSYFSTHFAPILSVFSLGSYLVPLPLPFYYALTQGLVFSTIAASGYLALRPVYRKSWLTGFFAILYAFNGPVQASIGFPHFEPIYAGFAVLFMLCLFRRMVGWSVLFFILTLIVREDTGFHLFGFTFLLFLVSWLEAELKPFRKSLGWYSVVAFCYSVLAILCQKRFFPGDSAITRIYLGDPFLGHLNSSFLVERIELIGEHALYTVAPWLVLLLVAVAWRSWSLLIGFVAVLPWVGLNSIAVADRAGTMWAYYSFPVIVSLLWPSLWYVLKGRPQQRNVQVAIVQAVILLLSLGLYLFRYDTIVLQSLFKFPEYGISDYRRVERTFETLLEKEHVFFDASVTTLFPHRTPADRMIHPDKDNSAVEAVFGFHGGIELELVKRIAANNGLNRFYPYQGPQLYLVSNRDEEPGREFGAEIVTEDARLSLWMMRKGYLATWDYPKMQIVDNDFQFLRRLLCFGPYSTLPPGLYTVEFEFETEEKSEELAVVEVLADERRVVEVSLPLSEIPSKEGRYLMDIRFEVTEEMAGQALQFLFHRQGLTETRLLQVRLTPEQAP